MKLICICNSSYEKNIRKKANAFYEDLELLVLTNQKDIDRQNLTIKSCRLFWIQVELMWSNNNIYQGYDIALNLLEISGSKEFLLQITFFSNLSREFLFLKTNGLKKIFPHCFIHNNLANQFIQTTNFSKERWKYLRRYNLTLNGIVDKLFHDFYDLAYSENGNFKKKKIANLIKRLSNISDLLPDNNLKNLIKIITLDNFNQYRNQLFTALSEEVNQSNSKLELINVKSNKYWRPSILIVEDDISFAKLLINKLAYNFKVYHYTDGKSALLKLKKEGFLYNALICDLELLEVFGYEQEIQGIDIIQYVEKCFPHIIVNVLTNIPKSGIQELLPNLTFKRIRYKSTVQSWSKSEWNDYNQFLKKEFKIQVKNKNLQGPNTSIWENVSNQSKNGGGLKVFYYSFKIKNKNGFDIFINEIYEFYEKVKQKEVKISTSFGKTKDRDILFSKSNEKGLVLLKKLLLHRLFWLDKLYDSSGYSYYALDNNDVIFFAKEFAFFRSTNAMIDKRHNAYSSVLGFPIYKENENKYKFTFNFLFPEEMNWLKKHAGVKKFDIRNEFSYLSNTFYSILQIISKANAHAFIQKAYPQPFFPNRLSDIEKLLFSLSNEAKKKSTYEDRENVLNLLLDFKENAIEEYNKLNGDLQSKIEFIISIFEVYSKYS